MSDWATNYIGTPYKDKGRGPDGFDCWGLVRAVYADIFQIELPSYTDAYENSEAGETIDQLIRKEKQSWIQATHPTDGDVVVLRMFNKEMHCGIIVEKGTRFLHTLTGHNCAMERLDSVKWKGRIVGYYRYTDL